MFNGSTRARARLACCPFQYISDLLISTHGCCGVHQDLDTLEEAVSMRALHAQLLESLTGELSSLGYGEEEYSWAVSVLHSRCFCLQQNSLHIAGDTVTASMLDAFAVISFEQYQ